MNTIELAQNVSDQCKSTATNPLSEMILVDGGTLRDLLNEAAYAIELLILEVETFDIANAKLRAK